MAFSLAAGIANWNSPAPSHDAGLCGESRDGSAYLKLKLAL